jgi:hypothetical protein
MRTHYKVVALLIVALIFSAAECSASCAFATCNPSDATSNAPPCHHHSHPTSRQNQSPCGHELQLLAPNASSISQSAVSNIFISAEPAPAAIAPQPDLIAAATPVPIQSPPQLPAIPLFVLRI